MGHWKELLSCLLFLQFEISNIDSSSALCLMMLNRVLPTVLWGVRMHWLDDLQLQPVHWWEFSFMAD